MIVFSTVDGHLHKREYDFVSDSEWTEYWKKVLTIWFIKSYLICPWTDFQRVQQFIDWLFDA
jgi:hypothetical protein